MIHYYICDVSIEDLYLSLIVALFAVIYEGGRNSITSGGNTELANCKPVHCPSQGPDDFIKIERSCFRWSVQWSLKVVALRWYYLIALTHASKVANDIIFDMNLHMHLHLIRWSLPISYIIISAGLLLCPWFPPRPELPLLSQLQWISRVWCWTVISVRSP